jgi:hypothetical protein
MNDPQHLGLGELGQRMQAMSDPAPEPRLRPYQGPSQPSSQPSNGHQAGNQTAQQTTPPDEVVFDYVRRTPAASPYSPLTGSSAYQSGSWPGTQTAPPYSPVQPPAQPAPAEPYAAYGYESDSFNGARAAGSRPFGTGPAGTGPTGTTASALPAPDTPLTQAAPEDPNAPKTGLQKAVAAVRSAIPLVQRLLPLLDGNFATVISSLVVAQQGHHPPPQPQAVKVDLEPVERGLAEVRNSNRELRAQVQEQGTNLKQVEDQLERVREATDRNTLEQQELVEDLRSVGSRISTFAVIGLVLLLVSLGLNIYFLVQLQHILR